MANLKINLGDKLRTDKMFAEIELVRLAQDPTMNYQWKIDAMKQQLQEIALLNAELGLMEQYFQEPVQAAPAEAPAPVAQSPAPVAQVHQGQTHGE